MRNIVDDLVNARLRYDSKVGKVAGFLANKIEFEFFIQYFEGDGHLIVNRETAYTTRIQDCLDIIDKQGTLTEEAHKELSI